MNQLHSVIVVAMTDGTVELRVGQEVRNEEAYTQAVLKGEEAAGRDALDVRVIANGLTPDDVDNGIEAACKREGVTHVRPAGRDAYAV